MLLGPGRLLGVKGGGVGDAGAAAMFTLLKDHVISKARWPHVYAAFALRNSSGQKQYVRAVATLLA